MKRIYYLCFFTLSLAVLSSCKHKNDNACTNNIHISTITQTVAYTGQSNGTILVQVTGDTSGTMYNINNGSFQAASEFTGLGAGKYTLGVTNSKKCTDTLGFTVVETDPCVVITVTVATATTNPFTGQSNGTITATASGGSGFTYSLNTGSFQQTGNFTNLAPGAYTVTAKNSYGCTGSTQVTLTAVDPCTVVKVQASATKTDPTNNLSNGTITASAANVPSNMGGGSFTYNLQKMGGPITSTFTANNVFSNLAVGNYIVTAKNSYNCTGTIQINLVSVVNCASKVIVVNATTTPVLPCQTPANNGSITATAQTTSGPSALPFSFSLSASGPFTTSGTFSNLSAGTYTVYVKDADGCPKTSSPITVPNAQAGVNFTGVRTMVNLKCIACHNSVRKDGGADLSTDCLILSFGSRIYARTILSPVGSKMPPSGTLSQTEIDYINHWNTAGRKFTD